MLSLSSVSFAPKYMCSSKKLMLLAITIQIKWVQTQALHQIRRAADISLSDMAIGLYLLNTVRKVNVLVHGASKDYS